jgi:hypothetical protein
VDPYAGVGVPVGEARVKSAPKPDPNRPLRRERPGVNAYDPTPKQLDAPAVPSLKTWQETEAVERWTLRPHNKR